jgi:hypothetical protein
MKKIPTAPMLSMSAPNAQAEKALTQLQTKNAILNRLLSGETALSIAQALDLKEKEVLEILKEGLAVQTEFMRENASSVQMMIYQRHEDLYRLAVSQMQYVEMVDVKDGDEVNQMAVQKTDINWFREARAQLNEISKLILPFLKEAKPAGTTINQTILVGDSLYQRVAEEYADVDVFTDD